MDTKAAAFLTSETAREAFEAFVLPGIMQAIANKHVKRAHLHVVTLIPGVPYAENAELPILFEYSVGEKQA